MKMGRDVSFRDGHEGKEPLGSKKANDSTISNDHRPEKERGERSVARKKQSSTGTRIEERGEERTEGEG